MRNQLLVALLPLFLSACATVAPPPGDSDRQTVPEPTEPAPARPPESETVEVPASVRALVREAEAASSAGRNDEAAAKLERALRVAPRNAVIWQNLAVVRYRQDRCDEAINLAQRSNDLGERDRGLQATNWRLIAACRKFQGDSAGAREADARARRLDGGQ
ncbi:tetratricopeptide repeat protein [Arhodomonas sp. AD133]|uniref:tetratricopeptide repeat protein n=1 Tax=Arhodomonas sp. AD133 TaxID=3415009 RepID=UPI003EBD32BD